ncbi:hypothetical protein ACROYT_G042585 [Oculina patagonica]
MMRNQRTYLANQDNKHRLEDECTDFSLNTSRNGVGEVSKRSRSDIELNPGPANAYMLLQSRLAQQGLSTLDVGGAGDCFFRAVSHQLYGEPSYHMNIRCVGVQYMRTNPERFIESIAGDSWARYLADMSQQGTWAEALVIQAVAHSDILGGSVLLTLEPLAFSTACLAAILQPYSRF